MSETESGITSQFADLGVELPAGAAGELFWQLVGLYEQRGVIRSGRGLPLWNDCQHHEACWKTIRPEFRPGSCASGAEGDGAIPLPWIGPEYRRGGLVIVGINLREASGLTAEYDIAATEPKGQYPMLAAGHRRPHGSDFAYRSCRSANAVLRSLDGERSDLDIEHPAVLADALLRVARLQLVKCSPNDGERSSRSREMDACCPPTYLAEELRILQPRVIIIFGNETWDALHNLGTVKTTHDGPGVWRATLAASNTQYDVFWLEHPASIGNRWLHSHQALLELLRDSPAGL